LIGAVIADDEELARAELIYLLRGHQDVQILGEARNGIEALQLVETHQPDLLFLDINMPGMSGLDAAKQLSHEAGMRKLPHVIFATAYDQFAVEAFKINAVDYLLKPIEKGRLAESLARVRGKVREGLGTSELVGSTLKDLMKSLHALPQGLLPAADLPTPAHQAKLMIRSSNRLLLISPRDFIFASMEEGRLWMVGRECEGESSFKSLEDLHATLSAANFWRAHRSHLVNIDHIREIVPWFKSTYQIRMDDRKGTVIPVSRTQTRHLKELFNL
jgi:two-component system, LytTR family, response regulator LytT